MFSFTLYNIWEGLGIRGGLNSACLMTVIDDWFSTIHAGKQSEGWCYHTGLSNTCDLNIPYKTMVQIPVALSVSRFLVIQLRTQSKMVLETL